MKTYKIGVVLIVSVFTAVVSAVPGDQQPALGVVAAVGSLASTASPLASDVETAITTLERDWAMAIVTTDATGTITFDAATNKAYVEKAKDIGWANAIKASPQYGPELKKVLAR